MRWKVIWSIIAENELAEIWASSSDRQSVSESADLVDFHLEHSPENELTSLSEDLWTLDIPPL
jgi:hypothetical protein